MVGVPALAGLRKTENRLKPVLQPRLPNTEGSFDVVLGRWIPPGDGGFKLHGVFQPLAAVVAAGGRAGTSDPGHGAGVWDAHWRGCYRAGGVAAAGSPGQSRAGVPECIVFSVCAVRAGLPGLAAGSLQSGFLHQPVHAPGHDEPGDAVVSPGPDVGGDGGDHPGQRAGHFLQPHRPGTGSDLEIPSHRLGRHRPGPARLAVPGLLRLAGPARQNAAVQSSSSATPAACPLLGCMPPLCCS